MIGCLFYSSPEIERSLKVVVDGNTILSFLPKEALLIAISLLSTPLLRGYESLCFRVLFPDFFYGS